MTDWLVVDSEDGWDGFGGLGGNMLGLGDI